MSLLALSINYKLADVALRERVAFVPERMPDALHDALVHSGLSEVVIVSTCNRTELLGLCLSDDRQSPLRWLADYHQLSITDLHDRHELYHEDAAMRHMIEVTSGLDSMVLGEPQIFGQMKSAFAVAQTVGSVGVELAQRFAHVFSVAKKVRSHTAIGKNPVSVAYTAASLTQRIFANLNDTQALLIGAGETVELVAKHLVENGVRHLIFANRTLSHAQALAMKFNAKSVLLSDIPAQLTHADIVVSSTASQLPILGKGSVEQALKQRKHRPMLLIDLAVPRDMESQISQLDDVYLYTIDDLMDIINENKHHRSLEVNKAQMIIAKGIDHYLQHLRARPAVELLKALRHQAESLRDIELQKTLLQLANGKDAHELLTQLARNLTNKFIHKPSIQLKKAGAQGRNDMIRWTQELFELNPDRFDDG